LEKKEYNRGF